MQLQDKVIVLTGAGRIGLDVAQGLTAKGAKLAVVYMNHQPDLQHLKTNALYVKADLSQTAEIARIVPEIKKYYGRIDGLIHMAAIYKRTPWKTLSEKDWDENLAVIAKSAFLMSKACADEMNSGQIVLISDWSVLTQPYKDYLAYNVAKGAVEALTKSLAKELAPKIAVNCIAPGPILMPPDLSKKDNAEVLKNTPLQKWGGAAEITKAVMYLLDSEFTTGQILFVDGGRSIA